MGRLRSLARRYGLDALIVLAALEATLEIVLRQHSADAPRTTLWFAVPAAAAVVLPLLARRRHPFAAPASLWLLAGALSFVDERLMGFAIGLQVAGFAAAFLLGTVGDVRQARLGLVLVLGGAALIISNEPSHTTAALVFLPVLFGLGWLAGFALRERAEQAEAAEVRAAQIERERDAATRLAVAEERARIARELHDIVAHAMSVIVLQVGAVRHGLPAELEQDRAALQDVERTGRAALGEMRRLLGAMRGEHDELELTPQPGLGSLEPLLDEVRRAGLAVELHVEGERVTLPDAIDLSAYRIVQEGLTNALKHARARRADVVLRYRPDELQIDVRDDGDGPSPSAGRGHGLVGIGERVKLYGGQMSVAAGNGHGFVLSTRLPLPDAAR